MTYAEWKAIKAIMGEDNQKIIRDFERSNPGLAALFEQKEQEERAKVQQIMKEPDRMERWRKMAAAFPTDEDWLRRRQREVM
ncbi:hypothetical protein D7X25_21755 [bacterium 1XD42-8]|nr:hypothetical protein D7X25_21755 [bacterium 1XD42-8]